MPTRAQQRAERRSRLRAQVFAISGGRCQWPTCPLAATQMAHAHSVGAGGRASADTIGNVAALCDSHSLVSDGLWPGFYDRDWYEEQLALLGVMPPVKAWNVAEALKAAVAESRP